MKKQGAWALLAVGLLAAWPALAGDKAHYDVLIVIDSRKPEQVQEEHQLRLALETKRALNKLESENLPVDTYDVAKEGQKAAVDRLKIPSWQLPFLGVAALGGSDNVAVKVMFGGGPVDKMEQSVGQTMDQVIALLKGAHPPVGTASTFPSASATAASSVTPLQGSMRLGLVVVQNGPQEVGLAESARKSLLAARDSHGLTKKELPMFIVRGTNNEVSRRLGVVRNETPLVGVVELDDAGRMKRIVFRLASIKDPDQAAHDTVGQAMRLLQTPPPSP